MSKKPGAVQVDHLTERGVKIGTASSVIAEQWDHAEIYPNCANSEYNVSNEQRQIIQLFCSDEGGS